MPSAYGSLCDDFYVNLRLNVTMDLPLRRQPVLGMFDRVRRDHPRMTRLRRSRSEVTLEARDTSPGHAWLSLRRTHLRAGVVNPEAVNDAASFHALIARVAPHYLDLTAIDLTSVEILFGFDMMSAGNHDDIVFRAMLGDSPMGCLSELPGAQPTGCQPAFAVALSQSENVQAQLEIKTRGSTSAAPNTDPRAEPISLYVMVRRLGMIDDLDTLPGLVETLAAQADRIAGEFAVPRVLLPLRDAIASGNL